MQKNISDIRKAFIFAAGLGQRLRPLTADTPKPLICVDGKPLLEYAVAVVKNASISNIAINCSYLKEQLATYSHNHHPEIKIYQEDERLETAGGLKNAHDFCANEVIATINSDVIFTEKNALNELIQAYGKTKGRYDIFMLLLPINKYLGYEGAGDFSLTGDKIIAKDDNASQNYVFSGLQIINTAILADYDKKIFSLSEIYRDLLPQGRVGGIIHNGQALHVGDINGYNLAKEYFLYKKLCA